MATIKAVLKRNQKQDGTYPIVIRITKDRRSYFVQLDYSVPEELWDAANGRVRKGHKNSVRLNNLITKRISELSEKAISLETEKERVTAGQIKKSVERSVSTAPATFFKNAELYLNTLKKTGKYNQYTADKPRIQHFKDFLRGSDPHFADIDFALLTKFRTYLKSEYKIKSKIKARLSERSIVNHLVTIRSVFSFARKAKVIDRTVSPFGEDGIKIEFPESVKIGLHQQEVMALEKVELSDPYHNHCRNLWLYSFYFGGMRIADVLLSKWSHFQDGRLHYMMGKNEKVGSLKVTDKVHRLLDQYRDKKKNESDFIFPELKNLEDLRDEFFVKRTIAFAASAIDTCLRDRVAPAAGITKKLTMHIARHTFGNLSGKKIPLQILQQIYRHSDIKTTIGYQKNFIHEDMDDALDSIIGF